LLLLLFVEVIVIINFIIIFKAVGLEIIIVTVITGIEFIVT